MSTDHNEEQETYIGRCLIDLIKEYKFIYDTTIPIKQSFRQVMIEDAYESIAAKLTELTLRQYEFIGK